MVLPLGISWVGFVFLFDYLERRYFSHTIIPDNQAHKHKFLMLIATSLLFGVILDGIGSFILKLWYYPVFSVIVYIIIAPFAFVAYMLLLFLLYEFIRDSILKFIKLNLGKLRGDIYRMVMKVEILLGVIGYIFITYLLSTERAPSNGFYILLLIFVCTFLIFEFIGFKQNKRTLTYDLLSGNLLPIIFILIANILAITFIEIANAPFQVWHFANWPFDDVRLFNLPISALLLWPLQFPMFLSMLRSIFPSREIVW
jgi:hypothetical protein